MPAYGRWRPVHERPPQGEPQLTHTDRAEDCAHGGPGRDDDVRRTVEQGHHAGPAPPAPRTAPRAPRPGTTPPAGPSNGATTPAPPSVMPVIATRVGRSQTDSVPVSATPACPPRARR